MSADNLWTVYQEYNLDDVAAYDHPAAIDKILEVTQQVLQDFGKQNLAWS